MAILNNDFYAVKSGEVYPRVFEKGTECPECLVSVAESLGYIEKLPRENKMVKKSPENKMVKSAPENKNKVKK